MVHTKLLYLQVYYLPDPENFSILPGDMIGIHSNDARIPLYIEVDASPATIHGSCDLTLDPISQIIHMNKQHSGIINDGSSYDLQGKTIVNKKISTVPIFRPGKKRIFK